MLPESHRIERDADVVSLLRADGSVAAVFSARGADPTEIERVAKQDAEDGYSVARSSSAVMPHGR